MVKPVRQMAQILLRPAVPPAIGRLLTEIRRARLDLQRGQAPGRAVGAIERFNMRIDPVVPDLLTPERPTPRAELQVSRRDTHAFRVGRSRRAQSPSPNSRRQPALVV